MNPGINVLNFPNILLFLHNTFLFSFDLGPVHFIAFSTEFYFFTNYGWQQIPNQYKWLQKDLEVIVLLRQKNDKKRIYG